MPGNSMLVEIECHTDAPEDYSIIRRIEIPEVDYLLYSFPENPEERYTADEFKPLLKKVCFKRSAELVILVTDKRSGKSRALVCLLKWPVQGEIGFTFNKQVFDLIKGKRRLGEDA